MRASIISILIPCYNQQKHLDKCLSSLYQQTYKNLEIIIVNDGSTDLSEQIIDTYVEKTKSSPTIKIIKINQENKGVGAAVNTGIKYITGDFFCWQDSDDYYEINALEKLKIYLDENPEKDLVRGEVAFRHEENVNSIAYIGKSKQPNSTNIFLNALFHKDIYCYQGCFMVRSSFFLNCIKNKEIYPSRKGQNWQLLLPISYYGKCGYINTVVFNYIIRKNSLSHTIYTTKAKSHIYREYITIINNTLNTIDMPCSYRIWLMARIYVKYTRKQVSLFFKYLTKRYH